MPNIIRLIAALALLGGSIAVIIFGSWGWGILGIILALLVFVTFFFNEKMLLAQYYLRKENMEKAEAWLNKIANYERELISVQHGYYQLLLGLNCRDLRTLQVDPQRFETVAPSFPSVFHRVAESGIETPEHARWARGLGYDMALVGTALMRSGNPAQALAELLAAGREDGEVAR